MSAFDTGEKTKNGKTKYLIRPHKTMRTQFQGRWLYDVKFVPCGKCIGCRLDYASEWSKRLMLEKSLYPDNQCHFVTLTYDEDHYGSPSLSKYDLQCFMKRLREFYRPRGFERIRFFACGEYGSKSMRKHFHLILYGLEIPDLKQIPSNPTLKSSKDIERIWSNGLISIGDVTLQSCGYVAQYILKKRKGKDSSELYDKIGLVPEFVVMSRRPGIGADAFRLDWYNYHELFVDGHRFKPGKFYDHIFEREYGSLDCFKVFQDEEMENEIYKKTAFTDLDYFAQLEVEAIEKQKKTDILKRRNVDD